MRTNQERTLPDVAFSPVREEPRLTPDRIAEVRRRLRQGFYDSEEVAAEVARRILARGDL